MFVNQHSSLLCPQCCRPQDPAPSISSSSATLRDGSDITPDSHWFSPSFRILKPMPPRKQPVQDVEEDEDAAHSVRRTKTSTTASSASPGRQPKTTTTSRRPSTRQQSQQLQQLQQEVDDEEEQVEAHRPRAQANDAYPNPFRGWSRYYSNPHPLTLLRGFRNVTSLVGFLFFVKLFLYGDATSTGFLQHNTSTSTSAAFPHTAHEVPYATLTATTFDAMLSLDTKVKTSADNTSAAFEIARAAACENLVKIWHPVEMSTHMRCQAICEDVQIGKWGASRFGRAIADYQEDTGLTNSWRWVAMSIGWQWMLS